MSDSVITIRPEPGCHDTATAGRDFGLSIVCHPLFEVEALDWDIPAGAFDGLLLGSANALRHGGALVDNLGDKLVFAVGEATAAAAFERGMKIGAVGHGGLQSLVDSLAGQPLKLLRLTGEERVHLDPPPGIEITEVQVYRVAARPFSGALVKDLTIRPIVLLHSAGAARHFAAECQRCALDRAGIRLAALGPRIAAAAGDGWGTVAAAAEPSDAALLALAREMCHEPWLG